jgi:integrase/recombinase XerD
MKSRYSRPRKRKDMLTKGMVDKILDAAKLSSAEDWLFLMLLARTGRRLGEILAITPRDINYEEMILWTNIEKTRKPGARGMCFIDNKTAEALKDYIESKSIGKDERLFQRSRRTYQRMIMKYATEAGLDIYVSVHSLRHFVITELRQLGWSWENIQKVSGHKSVTSLAVYDHTDARLVEGDFRKALEAL